MKRTNAFSSRAFKRGTLSLIFTVVIVVLVILLNVVATAVSDRFPLTVDLTANRDYTISLSDEYASFVQNVEYPVAITVCAGEADFASGSYANYMVQLLRLTDYYNGLSDATEKYARQVNTFVKSRAQKSDRVSVTFADPNSVTDFASVSAQYAGENLNYGDIILDCEHQSADGSAYHRIQIVTMADAFTVEANQEYMYTNYYNDLKGSKLASSVISALYIVTSETSVNGVVLGGHDTDAAYAGALTGFLKKNNYVFTDVDNLLTDSIPEDTMFAVISAPQTDYTAGEIRVLEAFLKNDGNYGRTLVYLPAITQPELPNLEEFLIEWGIEMLPAIAYDEVMYYNYPVNIIAAAGDTEFTEDYDDQQQFFYPSPYRLARAAFETENSYHTRVILKSPETTYGYPVNDANVSENWTTADSEYKGPFDLAILSTYQGTQSTTVVGESHLLMLSGDSFLSEEALSIPACYNATLVLNVFNTLAGLEKETTVSIADKVVSTTSFAEKLVNSNAGTVVMIVFVALIPAALIVLSFVIWMKRKKK